LKQKFAAEFIGSMLLVMSTIGSMIMFTRTIGGDKNVALLANAIAVAFILTALIEIFGPISGAHFNPIVTLIMWLEQQISTPDALKFVLVQILGGILGTAVIHLKFWEDMGGVFFISGNVRNGSLYFGELVATFILILVILMLGKVKSSTPSLMVGFLVGGQIMATSSTIFANPQVTIARILTSADSGIRPVDAAVFILMQLIGALVAYAIYRLFFKATSVPS